MRDLAAARVRSERGASASSASSRSSMLSSSDSAISRCCAPSWRLRSSRWRSCWPASITRPREPRSSSQPRLQLGLQPAVLERDRRRRADRVEQLGLVVERAGRGRAPPRARPSLSIRVTARASSGPGSATGRPSGSAHVRTPAASTRGSASGRAARATSGSRRSVGGGSARSSTQQVADGRARQAGVEHRQQEDERRETDDRRTSCAGWPGTHPARWRRPGPAAARRPSRAPARTSRPAP